jgi:LmbE family N-acetylglucosaminyl deacetylase
VETIIANSVSPNPSGLLRELALGGPALAVIAHPDDESFGLGAVLAAFGAGTQVRVLCFTRGEASTLGTTDAGMRHC